MYISLYVVVNTFIGGRQPQNKLMRLRTFKKNAASPEEADELEEMTADEMAVDGYYVVAGIARHEYKQGWKFLTLWDGYGLSEAT